ncbi:hypothetical protein [Acidithrix ferrooxidans]|uniref:Poly(Hydroxyalcanoate) granule associated protein (Phasin) n=1 Tax=Acidithrix ferrooxidans TaxID=1280514 RepID=A0A0D8HIL6_9ACTN|nr:hypothetical protein [Acidithrix ferrooxidans]KJF16891.1 hypothetical protein AXFE_22460 [Acidithrix ferrooxidans]
MASKSPKDRYKKLLDAGKTVSRMSTDRVEEIARDLMHLSEVQRNQALELIEDVIQRSKRSTEFFADTIRHEVEKQVNTLKLPTKEDLVEVTEAMNQIKDDVVSLSALREELRGDVVALSEAVAKLLTKRESHVDSASDVVVVEDLPITPDEATKVTSKTPRRSRASKAVPTEAVPEGESSGDLPNLDQ